MGSPPIPDPLRNTWFSTTHAYSFGVTPGRLRNPNLTHPGRSLYIGPGLTDSWWARARGWLSILPHGTALCGPSAVTALGLPAPVTETVHVLVPPDAPRPRSRDGLIVRQRQVGRPLSPIDGVPVTAPAPTWVHLAETWGRKSLVVIGDAMLTRGLIEVDDLNLEIAANGGARGVVLLRQCVRELRSGAESPSESLTRLVIVDGGLPCPVVNPDIIDGAGGWIGRPDLAYPLLRLAIQYEGDVHRSSRRRWEKDIARDEAMRDHGWEPSGSPPSSSTGRCSSAAGFAIEW